MKEMKKSRVFICAALLLAMLLPAVMAHAEGNSKLINLEIVKEADGSAAQWSSSDQTRATFVFAALLDLLSEDSELLTETMTYALNNDVCYYTVKDEVIGFVAFGDKAYVMLSYVTENKIAAYTLAEVSAAEHAEILMDAIKKKGDYDEYYKVDSSLVIEMLKQLVES